MDKAIEMAIDKCIEEGVLKDFLLKNRDEVTKVVQLDYTFERQMMLEREEAERKVQEAREEEIVKSVIEGDYSIERGMEKLDISLEQFNELIEKYTT